MQGDESSDYPNWKGSTFDSPSKLHSMCSYMAMFPPAIPSYYIKKYTDEKDVVLDPFSGRGTTPLEACMQKRIGIGNDRNPLAYVLTFSKISTPTIGRIKSKLNKLRSSYEKAREGIDISSEEWKIRMLFDDETLRQLLFLKGKLGWEQQNVDAFITAMILGILHGNSDGYLSISMPNTFSMSPNYVQNYIKTHNLVKPQRNVFDLLEKKLVRCYDKPPVRGRAYRSDARSLSKIRSNSVRLLMTSPPYTRVIRYGAFNWIRLWFLGKNDKEVDKKLLCSQSLPIYKEFMTGVLEETRRVLRSDGTAVFVIGDVRDRESEEIENLADYVWKNCAQPLGFKLKEPIQADVIGDDTKVSKIWGETKKGRATKIDRILVLSK